ncbi:MAG: membrane protein insertion efficiency factor YidD [Acidobacteriia bacterium]|nr:membrane protein insertion efficiency factor YidD [Terriglobia bacterium]
MNLPRTIAIGLIWTYKLVISPLLPSACRFHPTCSEYMKDAIEKHGVLKGVGMGLRRLSRCHPFHQGGFDPVR